MLNSTLLLTLVTLAGLVLGFAREWLLIDAWGAGEQTDALVLALFLPDMVRMTLAAGLLNVAAVPLFHQQTVVAGRQWLNSLGSLLFVCALVLSGVFYLFAPFWLKLLGPGIAPGARIVAVSAFEILTWCLPGMFLHAVCGIWLQLRESYVLWGMGSFLFNLFPVGWLLIRGPEAVTNEFALACVFGSILMALIVIPSAWREGWRPLVFAGTVDAGSLFVRRIGPVLLSNFGSHAVTLVERMVASLLGEGMVTWVNLARKLINLPLIALPALNQVLLGKLSAGHKDERLGVLRQGLVLTSCLVVPAAVFIMASSPTLVFFLLPEQTIGILAGLLGWFSWPLLVGAWNALLARYAYANHDTRLPLMCELAGTGLHVAGLASLPFWFGVPGFALANFGAVMLTSLLLLHRQSLWRHVGWRLQWAGGAGFLLIAALLVQPMNAGIVQLVAGAGLGTASFLIMLAVLKPWKITV